MSNADLKEALNGEIYKMLSILNDVEMDYDDQLDNLREVAKGLEHLCEGIEL